MGIGDQTITFLPHDGADFRMGFKVHKAIDHMGSGALQAAGLTNIGGLIKAGFQLDQCGYGFPIFCRFAQSLHDGGAF